MNKCQNCGANINPGDAFCMVCGTKIAEPENNFNNTHQNQQMNNQFNNQMNVDSELHGEKQPQENGYTNGTMPQNDYINKNDLIDSYIGKNVNKLKKGGFSVNTLFFGSLYALYRKMWLLGCIWLAVVIIVNIFLPSFTSIISLIGNIVIAIQFKKMYLNNVEKQVDKIKTENSNKSDEQLMKICSEKGGTSFISVIVAIILSSIIGYYTFPNIKDIISQTMESTENNPYYYNNSSNTNNNTKTGNKGVIGNLDMIIPSSLEELDGNDTSKIYQIFNYDAKSGNSDDCLLNLYTNDNIDYYKDAKTYLDKDINRYRSANDTYSGISEKTINGKTWYYATISGRYSQTYYYSIVNNEILYEIKFEITDDDSKACSSAYNTVVNSLKFK